VFKAYQVRWQKVAKGGDFVGGFGKDVDMNRINIHKFDRVKSVFPSDRHELRRAAINYQSIEREYMDWKSELDLPTNYTSLEMELCFAAITTACQHFESSFETANSLRCLLEDKRKNHLSAICILLRQSFEATLTANWLCSETDLRIIAQRGYQITLRDLHNQYGFANQLSNFEPMNYNYKNINKEKLAEMKMKLLLVGNKLEFSGKLVQEIHSPMVARMFRNAYIGGDKLNLTWAYTLLSSIAHGTWLGFYPSEKELTYLVNLKDVCTRESLNMIKARLSKLLDLPI
jgi:hypothetical protein